MISLYLEDALDMAVCCFGALASHDFSHDESYGRGRIYCTGLRGSIFSHQITWASINFEAEDLVFLMFWHEKDEVGLDVGFEKRGLVSVCIGVIYRCSMSGLYTLGVWVSPKALWSICGQSVQG